MTLDRQRLSLGRGIGWGLGCSNVHFEGLKWFAKVCVDQHR